MNIRNCWFGERQNRKKGIKTPGQEHRYVVLVFSNLCLQSTPTSYLGTWGLGELGQRQISRLVAEWKCETGQEKQTCLASLKEVTLFFLCQRSAWEGQNLWVCPWTQKLLGRWHSLCCAAEASAQTCSTDKSCLKGVSALLFLGKISWMSKVVSAFPQCHTSRRFYSDMEWEGEKHN